MLFHFLYLLKYRSVGMLLKRLKNLGSLLQGWATWRLAALGFLNGAESGMGNRNLINMEPLPVIVIARVLQYSYSKLKP
jgi:hypothetical protein